MERKPNRNKANQQGNTKESEDIKKEQRALFKCIQCFDYNIHSIWDDNSYYILLYFLQKGERKDIMR